MPTSRVPTTLTRALVSTDHSVDLSANWLRSVDNRGDVLTYSNRLTSLYGKPVKILCAEALQVESTEAPQFVSAVYGEWSGPHWVLPQTQKRGV